MAVQITADERAAEAADAVAAAIVAASHGTWQIAEQRPGDWWLVDGASRPPAPMFVWGMAGMVRIAASSPRKTPVMLALQPDDPVVTEHAITQLRKAGLLPSEND